MDALECMEYGSSCDGSKPLTNPMSKATKQDNLIPRDRAKCRRALLSAPSSLSSFDFLSSVHEPNSDTSTLGHVNQPGCEEVVREGKRKAANIVFFEQGFVSARKYMNPAGSVVSEMLEYAETNPLSVTCPSSQSSQAARPKKKSKSRLPVQKNSLDNYFQRQASQLPRTPENSPHKTTIISSPLLKVAGSDAIYYCISSSSQDSNSRSQPDVCSGINVSNCVPVNYTAAPKKDLSDDMFGMFGFSDSTLIAIDNDSDFDDEVKPEYISKFPVEVLTNVLCRLPFIDLCLNINRVCLKWRNIISSAEVSV